MTSPRSNQPTRLTPEQIAGMSARDILMSGAKAKRLETVKLGSVRSEPELTDRRHADSLARAMTEHGQASPTTYLARFSEQDNPKSLIIYEIIDGFHRTDGAKEEAKTKGVREDDIPMESMVHYGLTDEELIDLRVHAIGSIKSVQFARVATWVNASFRSTPFAELQATEDEYLTSTQAFEIATLREPPFEHAIPSTQVRELRDWVARKTTLWEKKPEEIRKVLKTVETADPELILQVREPTRSDNADKRRKMLTPGKLQAVSFFMPQEPFYEAQNGIIRASLERGLSTEVINRLTMKLVKDIPIDSQLTRDEIYDMAMAIPDDELEPPQQRSRPERRAPVQASGTVFRREDQGRQKNAGTDGANAESATTTTNEAALLSRVAELEAELERARGRTSITHGLTTEATQRLRARAEQAEAALRDRNGVEHAALDRTAKIPKVLGAETDPTREYVSADDFSALARRLTEAEQAATGWRQRADGLHRRLYDADPGYRRTVDERQRRQK